MFIYILGGGLGGTRRGGPDVNVRHSGREEHRDRERGGGAGGDRDRGDRRRRSRSRSRDRKRDRKRSRSRSPKRRRRSRKYIDYYFKKLIQGRQTPLTREFQKIGGAQPIL